MERLSSAWERFVSGSEAGLDLVPPGVREGWLRCRELGVDPHLTQAPYHDLPAIEDLRQEVDWLCCAEPVLSLLRKVIFEPAHLLLLCDHEGRILFAHGGSDALSRAENIRAVAGGRWCEKDVGYTAIGASLHNAASVQVELGENYCKQWRDWSGCAVPIRHPTTRQPLGTLDLASYRRLSRDGTLAMLGDAVSLIERNILESETALRAALLERFSRLSSEYSSDALFGVDGRGLVIALNRQAEKRLGLSGAQVIGRRVSDIPALSGHLAGRSLADLRESVELSQVTVFPASSNRSAGAVLLLAPQSSRGRGEGAQLWSTSYTIDDLVGQSAALKTSKEIALRAAKQDWPVLLLGESGTGKELFAQAIHHASERRRGPFVTFSCGAISDELVSAELFGYSAASFTGAAKGGKPGKAQIAHGGTLFLDDIESIAPRMQVALLRLLEDKRVIPLGADKPSMVDLRVIAASNADLEKAVADGRFRHDLYYRLNVIQVNLPSLRERADDVLLLADHFLSVHAPLTKLTDEVKQVFLAYSWPGNVRELKNVILTALTRAEGTEIGLQHLPHKLAAYKPRDASTLAEPHPRESLKSAECEVILRVLNATDNVVQAASHLGIHYTTLYRKMKRYGISHP